jgi:hypothetical protein
MRRVPHGDMIVAMRLVALTLLTCVACGGKATTTNPDGGSPGVDATAMEDAPTTPTGPEAGSAACDDAGTCVLCADGLWHCGASVFLPCPAGLDAGANCIGAFQGSDDCFACASNGAGDDWHCTNENPNYGYWTLKPMPCAP